MKAPDKILRVLSMFVHYFDYGDDFMSVLKVLINFMNVLKVKNCTLSMCTLLHVSSTSIKLLK
jgi:hypothetical protein